MSPSRRGRRIFVLVLLAAAVWAGLVGVTLVRAKTDLDRGRAALERARDADSAADLAAARPVPDLRRAHAALGAARKKLGSPWMFPARYLPFAGRQIRSAHALSGAAETVAGVGAAGIEDAKQAFGLPRKSGADRVALVRRVGAIASTALRGLREIDLGPSKALIGPLRNARADVAEALSDLRSTLETAEAAATAAAGLLEGPRRYLVFGANNAEMRAGSGMFLTLAEMTASGGTLDLGPTRAAEEIPIPQNTVPVQDDMKDRWGWAGVTNNWTNLMLSPRFPESAALATRMWVAAGGQPVDGVIALDPGALKAILTATGPVTAGGRTIAADTVEEELLHAQYVRFANDPQSELRRRALGDVAQAAMRALNAGGWDPVELAEELGKAVRGRHLMIWSSRTAEQLAWERAGVDGSLRPDSLLVSVLNRGGNKLDRFLTVDASLDLRAAGDNTEATLTIRMKNTVGAGEPGYITGPYPGLGTVAGDYLGILAVNLPEAAGSIVVEGRSQLGVTGPDGPTSVSGFQFKLPRGAEQTVVIRFAFAGRFGSFVVEPSARIPAIAWRSGAAAWRDTEPRRIDLATGLGA